MLIGLNLRNPFPSSSSSSAPRLISSCLYASVLQARFEQAPKMSRHSQDLEAADIDKSYVDNVEVIANADKPNPRKEAPAYVAGLSPEERAAAEKALVRKIDIRLLPMIIVMYILNYLDRNNIVGSLGLSLCR